MEEVTLEKGALDLSSARGPVFGEMTEWKASEETLVGLGDWEMTTERSMMMPTVQFEMICKKYSAWTHWFWDRLLWDSRR